MGFWDQLSDAMPWNRAKVRAREELEAELHAIADEDAAPVGSAAQAMAEMRAKNTAKRAPAPAKGPDPDPDPGNTDQREAWRGSAPKRTSNEALKDFGRKKGV